MRINQYKTMLDKDSKLNVLVKESSKNYQVVENLQTPQAIVDMMNCVYELSDQAEEYAYLIGLNSKNKVLGLFELSHGTVNSSFMSPREVFIRATLCGAVNLVVIHNHPSGDPTPSAEDIRTTKRLIEAGELMSMPVMDHIIIGDNRYISLKNQGLI